MYVNLSVGAECVCDGSGDFLLIIRNTEVC